MRLITASLALSFAIVSFLPVVAADDDAATKAAGGAAPAASTSDKATDAAATVTVKKRKRQAAPHAHQGGGHGYAHVPTRKAVLTVAGLTDKQKSQLADIYNSRKDKFLDLKNQLRRLQADEWKDAQGVLTAEQIQALGGTPPAAAKADGGAKSDPAGAATDK